MLSSLNIPSWTIWVVGLVLLIIVVIMIVPSLKRRWSRSEANSVVGPKSERDDPKGFGNITKQAFGAGSEGRRFDRDRGEATARVKELAQLEAVIAKLACAIDDSARFYAKALTDAASRPDLDQLLDKLGRRFEIASERSAEQVLYAIGDLGDEIRKLTQAVRDTSALIRDACADFKKQSGTPDIGPPHQALQSTKPPGAPTLGLPPLPTPRSPVEAEVKLPFRAVEPIDKIIMARFDELDRATNRNFASLKSEFRQTLGDRVSDICLQDDAVLFFTSPERAIVHPWRNVPLNRAWHAYFDLRGRSNVPIRKVNRPAVILARRGRVDSRVNGRY